MASAFPPHTYAFDSTDNGSETSVSWESHALESHRCVFNQTNSTQHIPVLVQWRVTNSAADADKPVFWLDDWSLAIERADKCESSEPSA